MSTFDRLLEFIDIDSSADKSLSTDSNKDSAFEKAIEAIEEGEEIRKTHEQENHSDSIEMVL